MGFIKDLGVAPEYLSNLFSNDPLISWLLFICGTKEPFAENNELVSGRVSNIRGKAITGAADMVGIKEPSNGLYSE